MARAEVLAATDDTALCSGRSGDAAIRACSNLIRSGQLQGVELALAHINRALARVERDQINLALADLDAAMRIDQRRPAARVATKWPMPALTEQLNKKAAELSQAGRRQDAAALTQRVRAIAKRVGQTETARTSSEEIVKALTPDEVRTRRIAPRSDQAAAAAASPPAAGGMAPPSRVAAPAPRMDAASPGIARPSPPPAAGVVTAPAAAPPPPQVAAASPPPASAPASQAFPEFPWPPPAASASYVFPRRFFKEGQTLGEVTDAILTALERSGYVERSFFRTKADGVALVTRLESINEDGSPRTGPARWPSVRNRPAVQGLEEFLRGLFFVDRGRYRVIVFILQDKPFAQSSERVVADDARNWLRSGLNTLPPEIAQRPYGNSDCSALIYEFASDGSSVRVVESSLTGRQHLEKAGVIPYLGPAN
jgi:hypothetical protein